jgi:hypothetical protein
MNRRSAINRVGLIMGASIISTDIFLSCKSDGGTANQSSAILSVYGALISDIGHTILPATDKHPGYKAIDDVSTTLAILQDCYNKEEVTMVAKGLSALEAATKSAYKKSFVQLSEQEKYIVINDIDKKYFNKETKEDDKPRYYGILKEAILLTYFTHKKVLEGPMSYTKVPGKYDGAMMVDKNRYSTVYGLGA